MTRPWASSPTWGSLRGLYKNRRGWRRIVVGVVLVLLSSYPLTITVGWCRDQSSASRLVARNVDADISLVNTGPRWLVARLPEGFSRLFDRVGSVMFLGPATDADLAECGKLHHLRSLCVAYCEQVSDMGLEHLEGLSRLEYVVLSDTQVTEQPSPVTSFPSSRVSPGSTLLPPPSPALRGSSPFADDGTFSASGP